MTPWQAALVAKQRALYVLQGETAVYSDGVIDRVVRVRRGQSVGRATREDQHAVTVRVVDWKVQVSEVPSPAAGHFLRIGDRRYELIPFNGEPACRFTDSSETEWRLHTQEVQG